MNEQWEPLFQLELMSVIHDSGIKNLHIGASDSLIFEIMGESELPAVRLNKKSKIFSHLYGNVCILSENGKVIAIDIDFHGNRKKTVILGEIDNWDMSNWLELSEKQGWNFSNINGMMKVSGDNFMISLSEEGKVGMVSIR